MNIQEEVYEVLARAKNFCSMATWEEDKLYQGFVSPTLVKYNNKVLHDFVCGIGIANVGHGRKEIERPVFKLISRFGMTGAVGSMNKPAMLLAKKLCNISPGNFAKKVYFCESGAMAVAAALVFSMHARPERQGVLSFLGAFHGRGLGRDTTTSKPVMLEAMPRLMPQSHYLRFPSFFHENEVERKFTKMFEGNNGDDYIEYVLLPYVGRFLPKINCAFIELIQGEGGMNVAHMQIMQKIVAVLREHGVYIVVDEIQTGMARTGSMFACDQFGIVPDILLLSKSLGSGVQPIAAVLITDEIAPKKDGIHSCTFGGNAPACMAGLKTIQIIQREKLAEQAYSKGCFIRDFLPHHFFSSKSIVDDVTGLGMMNRITFRCPDDRFHPGEIRDLVIKEAFELGLYLIKCGQRSIRLIPALVIDEAQIEVAMNILARAIVLVAKKLGYHF